MRVSKIAEGIWKFTGTDLVNCYLLEDRRMMIDAGNRADHQDLKNMVGKVFDPYGVETVVLTHLHFDHCGNLDLFPNAQVHASDEAIAMFHLDPKGSVLNEDTMERLQQVAFRPLGDEIEGLEVIGTPGHASGSVCLWDEERRILFTGDFTFGNKRFGRTDLPTSEPDLMAHSAAKLLDYDYDVLAPGHDYEMDKKA